MSTSARILRPMPAVEVDPYDVTTFPRPQPWTEDAGCLQSRPDLFFSNDPRDIAEAKQICGTCPVREKCLSDALQFDDPWSIQGGMTPAERRALVNGGAA